MAEHSPFLVPLLLVNFQTLKEVLASFKEMGLVKSDVDLEMIVDRTFIDRAIKEMGLTGSECSTRPRVRSRSLLALFQKRFVFLLQHA